MFIRSTLPREAILANQRPAADVLDVFDYFHLYQPERGQGYRRRYMFGLVLNVILTGAVNVFAISCLVKIWPLVMETLDNPDIANFRFAAALFILSLILTPIAIYTMYHNRYDRTFPVSYVVARFVEVILIPIPNILYLNMKDHLFLAEDRQDIFDALMVFLWFAFFAHLVALWYAYAKHKQLRKTPDYEMVPLDDEEASVEGKPDKR